MSTVPGKPAKRALRRHHASQCKSRVTKTHSAWIENFTSTEEERQRLVGILARTPKPCSCGITFCGNPRRHWKQRTLQERRQESADLRD